MTHLWKFSTSSTVSGKTLPLVSGRSSTNPPAIKPSTASKQRHKELVSICQPLLLPDWMDLSLAFYFKGAPLHKVCTSSLICKTAILVQKWGMCLPCADSTKPSPLVSYAWGRTPQTGQSLPLWSKELFLVLEHDRKHTPSLCCSHKIRKCAHNVLSSKQHNQILLW